MRKDGNVRLPYPHTDHLEGLHVAFIGVVESQGVYKDSLLRTPHEPEPDTRRVHS